MPVLPRLKENENSCQTIANISLSLTQTLNRILLQKKNRIPASCHSMPVLLNKNKKLKGKTQEVKHAMYLKPMTSELTYILDKLDFLRFESGKDQEYFLHYLSRLRSKYLCLQCYVETLKKVAFHENTCFQTYTQRGFQELQQTIMQMLVSCYP